MAAFALTLFAVVGASEITAQTTERPELSPAARTKIKQPIGRLLSLFAPAGNNVIVAGSVIDAAGAPIPNSVVVLMDDENGLRYVRTGSFGQFVFHDVVPNETYVVSVAHRKYLFAFPAFVIEVQNDVTNIVFIGEDDQF
ncbi:MAG TPA: carboxypeptidase-like regulatory domain-containing protein [Pyrinomonadaceae bacterium]|nr:carboxypeptidase-like regulatory domain-containing protein [Pyrinomonadaceae bacterium]